MLHEGHVYAINQFEVIPAYDRYKVTDNTKTIRFTDATMVTLEEATISHIKPEFFRLSSYSEYVALANSNLQLPGDKSNQLNLNFNLSYILSQYSFFQKLLNTMGNQMFKTKLHSNQIYLPLTKKHTILTFTQMSLVKY